MPSRLLRTTVFIALVSGCTVGAEDDEDVIVELADAEAAFGKDPCQTERATVKASGNGHTFIGTDGVDVIKGTNGKDEIFGKGGDDLICGFGDDDTIDGGDGRDLIIAGKGNDVVHGRGGSDRIYGGPGNDTLFGDILDDKLYGEEDDDTLVGGHGTDILDGGAGADFLRGDTGNDEFEGGGGYDIGSWATALPPGQTEYRDDGTAHPITGVLLELGEMCKEQTRPGGCANGDGGNEPLHELEEVVGSAFADRIRAGERKVTGVSGADEINTAAAGAATPQGHVFVQTTSLQGKLVDVGVIVLGTTGADTYQVVGVDETVVNVIATGGTLTAGAGCVAQGTDRVHCDVGAVINAQPHRPAPFHYVAVWGDAGADTLAISGNFPREFEAHASGGEGTDRLTGGGEQDVFFTGTDGTDTLLGNDGDDALLSESHHKGMVWKDGNRPEVRNYNDGGDTLNGGAGNDQLVADYVCGGHTYIGGGGHDIAGFARSGKFPIHAQLGGGATVKSRWWGKAANMDLCGGKEAAWTTFRTGPDADLEVLEAADGADYLWGDNGNNVIWGRAGGDTIYGLGGRDEILGADGNDVIDSGPGKDYVEFGANDGGAKDQGGD
jgi:Ca2+-binding RTX toxin-like protein